MRQNKVDVCHACAEEAFCVLVLHLSQNMFFMCQNTFFT